MVIGEGEVHHGADFYLISNCDGALLDRVKTEDGRLGWVQDWSGENRAVHPSIGNREDSAHQVRQGKFAFTSASRDSGKGFL